MPTSAAADKRPLSPRANVAHARCDVATPPLFPPRAAARWCAALCCGIFAPTRRSTSLSTAPWSLSAARTAPARPISSRRLSLFAPGRGLRRAELSECARVGGAGGFAVSIEIEEEGDRRQLGIGLGAAGSESGGERQAASIARRALGARLCRPYPARLADAGNGRTVLGAGERAAALSRPAGARHRPPTRRARKSVRARAARPQPAARRGRAQPGLARRDRARGGRTRRRGRSRARRMRRAARRGHRRRCATTIRRFPGRRSRSPARWKPSTSALPALEAEDRYRELLAENRGRDAAAGRTLIGPHLCRLRRPSRAERRGGGAMFDRRAEGAAGRAGARPRAARRRHVGDRAAGAARRSRRAFRPAPAPCAVRSARDE